jgi:hypothetical protein
MLELSQKNMSLAEVGTLSLFTPACMWYAHSFNLNLNPEPYCCPDVEFTQLLYDHTHTPHSRVLPQATAIPELDGWLYDGNKTAGFKGNYSM